MKKILLLFSAFLFAGSMLAVDVTVTESFSQVPAFSMKTDRSFLDGDLLQWAIRYGRRKVDDTLSTGDQATWINAQYQNTETTQTTYGYLEMNENFEGGIKHIAFDWGHGNEKGYTVVLRMFKRGTGAWEEEPIQTWSHSAPSKSAWIEHVSYDLEMKKNSRIKFDNLSVKTDGSTQPTEAKGRTLIGDITITPYLRYTKKQDTVVLADGTYTNTALINNTEEGNVTYTLVNNNPEIATIDATTGEVTPTGIGTVTVKACWEQVTTTYELTIAQKETFNSSEETIYYCTSATSKAADLATWTYLNGGVKSGLSVSGGASTFDGKAIILRAPMTGSTDECYVESSAIAGGLSKLTFKWNINGGEATTIWDIRILVNGRLVKTLTNTEITTTAIMTQPASITIDSIHEAGKFVLRIENHSTLQSGSITGNKARFTLDDLVLVPYKGAMVLDEGQDNSLKIKSNEGEIMNVQLVRTLAAGKYNSFCLPFTISKTDLAETFGEQVEITSLTTLDEQGGSSLSEDKKNLNVVMKEVDEMEAGKPYLITLSQEVVNPIFYDVTIENVGDDNYFESGDVKFYGITSPFGVPDDKTYLFVSNNKLNWNNAGATTDMKGLRAYFHVPGMTDPAQVTPRLVMRQPQTPTGVEVRNAQCTMHNAKFFKDGQLVISRDGKMYNALGEEL